MPTPYSVKDLERVLEHALEELRRAQLALTAMMCPETPMPRPRVFEIARGKGGSFVRWPHVVAGQAHWDELAVRKEGGAEVGYSLYSRWGAETILHVTGTAPRDVLRAVRRIQAATAWCRARRAGRERAAQEILRQQARAREALEAERVLIGLEEAGGRR